MEALIRIKAVVRALVKTELKKVLWNLRNTKTKR
jgi:hypothetical protein